MFYLSIYTMKFKPGFEFIFSKYYLHLCNKKFNNLSCSSIVTYLLSVVTICMLTLPFLLLILTYPALVTFHCEKCDSNNFIKEGLGSSRSFRGVQSIMAERYGWKALPVAAQAYRCCCCYCCRGRQTRKQ